MPRQLIDISQRLGPSLPVWPGDSPFQLERTLDIGSGCSVNVHRLSLSTQSGTHAEAPLHYLPHGAPVTQLPLEHFVGSCVVVDLQRPPPVILPGQLLPHLPARPERVLLRLLGDFDWLSWPVEWPALHPETIAALAAREVVLIGLDAPSVDAHDSRDLPAHHAAARAGIAILEGLVLAEVPAGRYELIALPLRVEGVEATPVRAVLRREQ